MPVVLWSKCIALEIIQLST